MAAAILSLGSRRCSAQNTVAPGRVESCRFPVQMQESEACLQRERVEGGDALHSTIEAWRIVGTNRRTATRWRYRRSVGNTAG
jgi:hypothetical protein